ncbi:MAG TPA: hypothetical protein VKB88_05495 [Bryobacteraceae bacterium]|nr:hypothetical protein [Bryobacteraceae bacterium]
MRRARGWAKVAQGAGDVEESAERAEENGEEKQVCLTRNGAASQGTATPTHGFV